MAPAHILCLPRGDWSGRGGRVLCCGHSLSPCSAPAGHPRGQDAQQGGRQRGGGVHRDPHRHRSVGGAAASVAVCSPVQRRVGSPLIADRPCTRGACVMVHQGLACDRALPLPLPAPACPPAPLPPAPSLPLAPSPLRYRHPRHGHQHTSGCAAADRVWGQPGHGRFGGAAGAGVPLTVAAPHAARLGRAPGSAAGAPAQAGAGGGPRRGRGVQDRGRQGGAPGGGGAAAVGLTRAAAAAAGGALPMEPRRCAVGQQRWRGDASSPLCRILAAWLAGVEACVCTTPASGSSCMRCRHPLPLHALPQAACLAGSKPRRCSGCWAWRCSQCGSRSQTSRCATCR